jgi:hypothetical protein
MGKPDRRVHELEHEPLARLIRTAGNDVRSWGNSTFSSSIAICNNKRRLETGSAISALETRERRREKSFEMSGVDTTKLVRL